MWLLLIVVFVAVLIGWASEPEGSSRKFEPNLIFKLLFWTVVLGVLALTVGVAVSVW